MNALPLVSVVVPNYNYKRYLNLRIQSILQQTYQNIELILLDDASTDGSEEVLSDYQDHAKVSHILLNEHNTGNPFKQWFKGMQLAKGKVSIRPRACFFPLFSFLPLWLHYNLNPLCVQY